ncbi:MAG: CobB/CobQ domain protein glutamine amidotransferase [Bacilli bacterium]|nr:CobB/CobQ domain protein glutamine amidotransferase [Bacilli bacterium]
MQKFRIAHLYPDLMEVYSDRGNVIVLQQRMKWRGYEAEVDFVTVGETSTLRDYDIVFAGGGEDRQQAIVARDLLSRQGEMEAALQSGSLVLTICGSYQLMGHYFQTLTGERIEGLGLLDLYTVGSRNRLIGNAAGILQPQTGNGVNASGVSTVVGYENHSGRTYLGQGVRAWFEVLSGAGNNGSDAGEGAQQGGLYGTYYHGPLLAKNPHLADDLLQQAMARRGSPVQLSRLDDELELAAHRHILKKLQTK